MWKLSRYWNRLAFKFISIGRSMIWDQTHMNKDLLKYFDEEYEHCKEILTYISKR